MAKHHQHGNGLGQHGCPCGSCDSHVEHEDEYRVEDGVEDDSEYGQPHRLLRTARRTHGRIQTEVQVGDDVSVEDDLHIFLRIGQRVLAGSEEIEDGVYEYQGDNHEYQTDDDVQADYVSEDLVGRLVVLLPEKDRKHGGSSGSHQGSECRGEVHQREGHRET